MYTTYDDSQMAQMMSNEKVSQKRDSIQLNFSGEWFRTVKNSVACTIEAIRIRRDLRRVPQPIRQRACQEVPQYCEAK